MLRVHHSIKLIIGITIFMVLLTSCATRQASTGSPDLTTPSNTVTSTPVTSIASTVTSTLTVTPDSSIRIETKGTATTTPDSSIRIGAKGSATTTPDSSIRIEAKGSLLKITLPTKLLKYDLEAKVYLPPGYRSDSGREYPVLYMLHGMTDTEDQWIRLGMTDLADQLISEGLIQPLIIVMPYEINWQLQPEDSNYGKAIVDVLIPYVEEHYSACTERACRAIGGLSRGGNWAVDIGFANWQMFTAIGAHSTPLFYGELTRVTLAVRSMPSIDQCPSLYVDAGKKDANLAQVEDFEKALVELKVPHEYHLNGGYHDDAYWSSHTEEYLLWYAGKLKAPTYP